MVTTDRDSVEDFLKDLQGVLATGGKFYVIQREKNRESLLKLGLTIWNCRQEVLALTIGNYCSGPDPDPDPKFKGVGWVFGTKINGHEIYIKVKVTKSGAHQAVTCISFHESEYSLRFVYR